MSGTPPEYSAPRRAPLSTGAVVALVLLSVFAVLVFLYHGFTALLLTEPPECFMQLTPAAEAQCEQARAEGWSMVPSMLLGGLALLPLVAVSAAWVLRRRGVAVRWIALAVLVASLALGFLVPTS
ncbi:hypothetical protein F4561_003389 [Lipingzhangella halophila]|uniref:Uncharacterized protein n=1 Tax=Lipingzhangella halophila TaxID=1783352 RepID=A0A7W7RIF5_9ACTN|nr:hypothetical protein [Lipingzhangella halophila]MBB4932569.1 hypothetical protein [Lipingzhangella halophila]